MYKDYFRLKEMPFSIAPDPHFLFLSDRHREAIAHLLYGVQGEGGIVLLTGEVGTGKTTVCRSLLDQLPDNIDVAFILNPRMNVRELLQTVCEEFRIDVSPSGPGSKVFVDAIHDRLLNANADGRRAILIVDEAQNLDPLVLEQLRLLTNLETNTRKLLQIFLIGQPELQTLLARPEMRQVAQRVVARYHLTQLSASEVKYYISHRLTVSGGDPDIFPDSLMRPIFRASGGVPRLINLVCDRAMLGTYVKGLRRVTAPILLQAVKEVFEARRPRHYRWPIAAGFAALAGALVVGATGFTDVSGGWFPRRNDPPLVSSAPASVPEPAPLATVSQEPPLIPTPSADPPPKSMVDMVDALVVEKSPVAVDSLVWPGTVSPAKSEILAFQSLFKIHGLDFDVNSRADPCHQAEASGLHCYFGRGGLSELLMLDHPVVMRLSSDRHEYSATLIGLDKAHEVASLLVAGDERHIALAELAKSWSGKYVLLWQAPKGFRDGLTTNSRSPAVSWLRQTMTIVDGHEDDGSNNFDAALAQRVRAFQLAEGIQPDGVVGPRTAIRLNVRSGRDSTQLVIAEKG